MKLINKSTDTLKRKNQAGTWVRIKPGENIELPEKEAAWLLENESFWKPEEAEPKPAKKPAKRKGGV